MSLSTTAILQVHPSVRTLPYVWRVKGFLFFKSHAPDSHQGKVYSREILSLLPKKMKLLACDPNPHLIGDSPIENRKSKIENRITFPIEKSPPPNSNQHRNQPQQ